MKSSLLMMRLICLGLLLCFGERVAWGQGTAPQARVAIVGGVGTEDLAALLTAELSNSPAVALVERDELAKAGDERQLQKLASGDAAALGRMLGAEGVVFLSKSEDGLQVRFTAAGLGYALFDDRFAKGGDLAHLGKTVAERVAGYAPKLKLRPEEAVPISLLNLRADQASPQADSVERKLSLLLESRLAVVPKYVIVERRHASAIRFENLLTNNSLAPIPGVSVVDGTLSVPLDGKDEMVARLRLRTAGKAEVSLEFRGSMKDLPGLAEKMAAGIGEKMGVTTRTAAWDTKKEAREYLLEGVWASQHNANVAALEALDSAELLGENLADVMAVRIPVLCGVAVGSSRIFTADEVTPSDPHPEARVEAMLRAFDEEAHYERDDMASRLQTVHPDRATLGDVRIRRWMIARAAASLLKMLDATHSPLAGEVREPFRAFIGYDPAQGKLPEDLTVSIRYADAWANTMEEEKAYYKIFLESPPDTVGWRQLQQSIYRETFCERFFPDPHERYVAYLKYLESLTDGPGQMTALLDLAEGIVPGRWQDEACDRYFQALMDRRDKLAASKQLAVYLAAAFDLERQRGRSTADSRLIELEHFLLLSAERVDGKVAQTWRPELFPAKDAPGLWKDFQALEAKPAGDAMCVEQMSRRYLERFGPEEKAGALSVDRFWYPPNAPGKVSFAAFPFAAARDGVWLGANYFGTRPCNAVVYHVALGAGKVGSFGTEAFPLPDFAVQTLAAGRDGLYVLGNSGTEMRKTQIRRLDLASRHWESHESPPGKRIFEAGGNIYFSLMGYGLKEMEGGIVRVDEKTGAQTVLASSRRRPPLNQFDDREFYEVKAIFAGPGGKSCASIGYGEVYEIEDKPGEWPLAIPSGGLSFAETEGSRTLLYGEQYSKEKTSADVVFMVDSAKAEPEIWLGASSAMLGTKMTGQVAAPPPQPEWALHPRWVQPPANGETERAYGFRGDDLFAFVFNRKTLERALQWYRSGQKDPVTIPLDFKMSEEATRALKAAFDADKDPIKNQRPPNNSPLKMYRAPQGLCFVAPEKGFWYLPFADVDAYLKTAR